MSGEEGRYVAALLDRARNRFQGDERRQPGTTLRAFRLHGLDHWLVRERDAFVQTAKAAVAAAVAWGIASTVQKSTRLNRTQIAVHPPCNSCVNESYNSCVNERSARGFPLYSSQPSLTVPCELLPDPVI